MVNKYKFAIAVALAAIPFSGFSAGAGKPGLADVAVRADRQTPHAVNQMGRQLLGPYHAIGSLTASNIAHAYTTFLAHVREVCGNWAPADWEHANAVLYRLDKKSNAFYHMLSVNDQATVKSVGSEFRKLRKKHAAAKK